VGKSGPMKPILSRGARLASGAAFLLSLACAAAAVLGQAGRWNRVLDVANNFAPVWVAGGLAAGLIWLLSGRSRRATPWLAAAAVLISAFQMAPELLTAPDSAQAAPVGKTFKVTGQGSAAQARKLVEEGMTRSEKKTKSTGRAK